MMETTVSKKDDLLTTKPSDKKILDPKDLDNSDDYTVTPSGEKVLDKGETIVNKMNRTAAVLDRELFIQDLYENWLICVDKDEPRVKQKSGILLRWDITTTFEDFISDAIENIDRQLESIKFARDVNATKISATQGDFFLSEAKIDKGSQAVEKEFSIEDHEATNEILRKSKEILKDCISGKLNIIINTETGRIRLVAGTGV